MKRDFQSIRVHESLDPPKNFEFSSLQNVFLHWKFLQPLDFCVFRLNRWNLGFSVLSRVIHVWHIFPLPHTRMAQGKTFGLAGAIHVRVWPAHGGFKWLAPYTYGPSHTRMGRNPCFHSHCYYTYDAWWYLMAICVWVMDAQFFSFSFCLCNFVWILFWSLFSWFFRPLNKWNTTSSA